MANRTSNHGYASQKLNPKKSTVGGVHIMHGQTLEAEIIQQK